VQVWGVLGDQPTAATGTVFRYTVSGIDFLGTPLRAKALFKPLLWINGSEAAGSGDGIVVTSAPGGLPPGPCRRCLPSWRLHPAGGQVQQHHPLLGWLWTTTAHGKLQWHARPCLLPLMQTRR
jgi:hypothetical protein